MSFVDVMRNMANQTLTENGAIAYNSTKGGAVLDLYAKLGGMRKRSEQDIIDDWKSARNENSELADNLVLYARNIRDGGLGERRIGRILLGELGKLDADKIIRNFQTIVDTGRWDDLYVFLNGQYPQIEQELFNFIENQLRLDVSGMKNNEPISILAKWLPSINTSSEKTRKLARKICKNFHLTDRTYRKTLSQLRSYLNIVEKLMSAGEWDKINFEAVPSVAMNRYIKTYNKRCYERFSAYKAALVKGEVKVNAATLYPYDIVSKALYGAGLDDVDEAQWKALPNYVKGEYDVVVMADVSGSMTGTPMATSVGLATYFAQRNKGAYHNLYLTFSRDSHFIEIQDTWTLRKCINFVQGTGMGYNTNLDSAFCAIYNVAKETLEAPKALVIISDGQFDWDYRNNDADSIVGKWNKKFVELGLNPIKVISWNVEARQDNYIATTDDNIAYCSGAGAGPFKNLTELIELNAYEAMVKIITQPAFCWK